MFQRRHYITTGHSDNISRIDGTKHGNIYRKIISAEQDT